MILYVFQDFVALSITVNQSFDIGNVSALSGGTLKLTIVVFLEIVFIMRAYDAFGEISTPIINLKTSENSMK